MDVDMDLRKDVIEKLTKLLNKSIAKDIEESIYLFSKEYAETNDAPFIIEEIYNSKKDEILALLTNKESDYLISLLKSKDCKIDPKKIAFMSPETLNPEKYEMIIKKRFGGRK